MPKISGTSGSQNNPSKRGKIVKFVRSMLFRVRTAQGKPGKSEKRDFFEKNQVKPGKFREFSDHFYNLRDNSGNFILPNISDQIGGAPRIDEQ